MRHERIVPLILIFFACGLLGGCATPVSDMRLGTEPNTPLSNADPASYGADGFTFSKPQKRRDPNNYMFYYKHCTQTGDDRAYFSRTSYWCSDP